MQEDKEPCFLAFDSLDLALSAMTGMVADMQPVKDSMARAAGSGYSTATDLADWLVRVLDMPFRDAHHITGAAVKRAESLGLELSALPLAELQTLDARITPAVYEILTAKASVASRRSYGGTAPDQVRAQIQRWKDLLA
jgi:argininosuccinate lyase